jgi:YggT family protein
MTGSDSLFTHWYFHLPNLILAAMIYTLIGRYLLELFLSKRPDAVILKVFRQITDPIVRLVRTLTPAIVPNGLVIVFAIIWLLALRMFLYLTVIAAGVKPFLIQGI